MITMGVKMTSFKTKETQPDGTEIEVDMPGQANDCPPLPKLENYKNPNLPSDDLGPSQKE